MCGVLVFMLLKYLLIFLQFLLGPIVVFFRRAPFNFHTFVNFQSFFPVTEFVILFHCGQRAYFV